MVVKDETYPRFFLPPVAGAAVLAAAARTAKPRTLRASGSTRPEDAAKKHKAAAILHLSLISRQIKITAVLTEVKQACTAEDFEHPDITFVNSADDVLQLDEMQTPFHNCTLQRFDDDQDSVLSVLRGKHLVLVGDSLTRYQYLSLVYFLESGNWSSDYPNQMWEKDFKSWNQFYQVSQCTDTAKLNISSTLA
eukprot:11500-Heterococcus_DN1.PRE.1